MLRNVEQWSKYALYRGPLLICFLKYEQSSSITCFRIRKPKCPFTILLMIGSIHAETSEFFFVKRWINLSNLKMQPCRMVFIYLWLFQNDVQYQPNCKVPEATQLFLKAKVIKQARTSSSPISISNRMLSLTVNQACSIALSSPIISIFDKNIIEIIVIEDGNKCKGRRRLITD